MVKRAKTPPPDRSIEPVFYTITYPYPPFANLELPKDRMDLARWVACILGDPKYLFALYFKPSVSPQPVLVAVPLILL
ncbi:hypothetical protein EXIGLDRAFT_729137 [Exidia glandulosa HHB12029]|uniref:Uncharacterized protein n=1 Tax=Exidia glandulosa HHB12029 TaxID=1314781 RepID=A0A165CQ49_EXIGL|nr:hypothetical protein EXIGLDRAFT_729137 [Exidia glandulosa HHB12029]